MRLAILAASALAFAACSPSEPKPAEPAAAPAAPAADAHSGMAMDDAMKMADAKDDTNTAESKVEDTFHTDPSKVESVHLPTAAGNVWTATPEDPAMIEIVSAADETMKDGAIHRVVKVKPKAAGNTTVKFERHASADANAPVTDTRTFKFMIH